MTLKKKALILFDNKTYLRILIYRGLNKCTFR